MATLVVEHGPHAQLRIAEGEAEVWIDPYQVPPESALSVITWGEPERLVGVEQAISRGMAPRVVASREVRRWLETKGNHSGVSSPTRDQGLHIDTSTFRPLPYLAVQEGCRKVVSLITRPQLALSRIKRRRELPGGDPQVVFLTLPSGRRVIYLSVALHARTPEVWLNKMIDACRGSDLVVAGVDYEEVPAFLSRMARFKARKVILIQPHDTLREQLGLPIQVLGPVARDLSCRGTPTVVLEHGQRWEGVGQA